MGRGDGGGEMGRGDGGGEMGEARWGRGDGGGEMRERELHVDTVTACEQYYPRQNSTEVIAFSTLMQ
jgi:hypothetical protein